MSDVTLDPDGIRFDPEGYMALLQRILQARTAGELEALVPEIAYFSSTYRRQARAELTKAWLQRWHQHVRTPIRGDLWPTPVDR
jgi:hypothetical protein